MSNEQFSEMVTVNQPIQVSHFKFFPGRNIDQMPLLLSGKDVQGNVVDVPRVPLTGKQLLEYRLHGQTASDKASLTDNYAHVACGVLGDPQGSGEVVVGVYAIPLVTALVNSLSPANKLVGGALPVNVDQYQTVKKDGFVFSKTVANDLRNDAYSHKNKRRAFWEYLAEGDTKLSKAYIADVLKKTEGTLENRLDFVSRNVNLGFRLLCVGSVGGGSSIAGGYDLDGLIGRLVGVSGGAASVGKEAGFTDARADEYFAKLRHYTRR